jgi:amidase
VLDKFGRPFTVDGRPRPYWDQVKWCGLANLAGTPSTTIPTGLEATSGLPIGNQAMGPAGGDLTTIEFAALLGEELGGGR